MTVAKENHRYQQAFPENLILDRIFLKQESFFWYDQLLLKMNIGNYLPMSPGVFSVRLEDKVSFFFSEVLVFLTIEYWVRHPIHKLYNSVKLICREVRLLDLFKSLTRGKSYQI